MLPRDSSIWPGLQGSSSVLPILPRQPGPSLSIVQGMPVLIFSPPGTLHAALHAMGIPDVTSAFHPTTDELCNERLCLGSLPSTCGLARLGLIRSLFARRPEDIHLNS